AQCTNNLKQLALAAANYESTNGCFPGNSYEAGCSSCFNNFSSFVRLLPFTEQSSLYNAVNFSLTNYEADNITVHGIKLSVLACPSDRWQATVISSSTPNASFEANLKTIPPGSWQQQFTSYGCNAGTYPIDYRTWYITPGNATANVAEFTQLNGVIYN